MVDISFSLNVPRVARVSRVLNKVLLGINDAFGKGAIEKFLLRRTLERFATRGANASAQKTPTGGLWPRIKPITVRRRKKNKNANQALVDTGFLRNSIQVFNKRTSKAALASGNAGFTLGVRKGSPAFAYGNLQNFGGVNSVGVQIRARKFLGIGQRDAKPLGKILKSAILARLDKV